jgi:hypothetical protein
MRKGQGTVERLFKFGEGKFDIPDSVNKKFIDYIVDYIGLVPPEELVQFLEYQLDGCKYQYVFLNDVLKGALRRWAKEFSREKTELFLEYCCEVSELDRFEIEKVIAVFGSNSQFLPDDRAEWIDRVQEFWTVSNNTSACQYGLKLLQESLDLHTDQCDRVMCGTEKMYHFKIHHIQSILSDDPIPSLKRIQWHGTQKELAELLVELKRKNWISNWSISTIKACFTKTDSIQQILKPGVDKGMNYQESFDQIYTSKYEPQFDQIRER